MTILLDQQLIERRLHEETRQCLESLDILAEIDSTNSYLKQMGAARAESTRVALTTNQTAGRGRHGKSWQSPPDSSLCLSVAYTFPQAPPNLPALTLAIGLATVDALQDCGVTGIAIKWPNDLVFHGGKVGGILTETQTGPSGEMTVVTGIGINVNLGDDFAPLQESQWSPKAVDLVSLTAAPPSFNDLAVASINRVVAAFADYQINGFATLAERWANVDWLLGRKLSFEQAGEQFVGKGAGIAEDGALLVQMDDAEVLRVTSGSIALPTQAAQ